MMEIEDEDNLIRLEPSQTIKTCCDLADRLRLRFQAGDITVIDAGALEEGDITLVQILVAARRSFAL